MFPPRKILFPADFSERSIAAGRMVETLAGHFQAEVTILNVVEPLTYNDLPIDVTGVARSQLESFLLEDFKHIDVQRVLAHGDPALRIIEQAERSKADLIMLPTHGYGRFRRFILGSVAAKVLHDARCPVWTGVHMEEIPELENIAFKRVLCALDLGPHSCQTLKYAMQFAAEFGAELTVVHAVPLGAGTQELYAEGTLLQILTQNAEAAIGQLQAQLGSKAEVRVEIAEVPYAVRDCAQATQADVLVLGRSCENGVMGRLRTNAYSIIRQSPCPVISV